MRFYLGLFLVLIFVMPLTAQSKKDDKPRALTLQESVKLALANNRQILQGREMLNGTMAKISEYKSYLYPQLQTDANYVHLGLVPEYLGFQLATANNYTYKATIAQLLYAWGKVDKGIALSEAELTLVKSNITLTERDISFAVVQLFYQMLTIQESIKVIDENTNLLEQQLAMLNKKYEQGEVSDFDTLSTQVQISLAQGQRLDTWNNLQKIKLQFNLIIGLAVETPVELVGTLEYAPIELDESNYLNEALATRVEIQQIRTKEQMAQIQKDLAAIANKPNLNAFASWQLNNGNQPYLNEYIGAWTFGAMFSWPIFDGGRTKAQVRQAESNLNTIQLEYEQQCQTIASEVKQSVLDVQSAWQRIEINKLTVTQAEKALAIAEERFAKGLIDTLNLLTAQSALAAARLNLLQSVYNFNVSKYNLEKAVGREFTVND